MRAPGDSSDTITIFTPEWGAATGLSDGPQVQVTDGLQGKERVVTVGAFELSQEDDDVLAKTNAAADKHSWIPRENVFARGA